jgi:pre-mRNA-splicing factor SYF1
MTPPLLHIDLEGSGWIPRYSKLETDVGEVDRARAILVHASSLANPATDKEFWQAWNDFEVEHGNEDTFREMRRIMRSVNASFSQTHFNSAIIDSATHPITSGHPLSPPGHTPSCVSPQLPHGMLAISR